MSNELAPYQISRSSPPPHRFILEQSLFSSEVSFKEYWRVIRKHRSMIISLAAMAAVIVLAWRFTRTPYYEGDSTILIQPQTPQVLTQNKNFNDEQFSYSGDYDYYRTQFAPKSETEASFGTTGVATTLEGKCGTTVA